MGLTMTEVVFKKAMALTGGHEGGWTLHKHDQGGETVNGISRVYWPNWKGWLHVDEAKRMSNHSMHGESLWLTDPAVDARLGANDEFQKLVQEFYREHFWHTIAGNVLVTYDPTLSVLVYDAAVNHGPARAIQFLQHALNLLNDNEELYPDLVTDGLFGPRTLAALKQLLKTRRQGALRVWYIIIRGSFYAQFMGESKEQEAFAFGWARRLSSWMQLVDEDLQLD
jgi:lysozyme family protein